MAREHFDSESRGQAVSSGSPHDRLTCLDEDSVLAFVDGSLTDEERSSVEAHLADTPTVPT